MLLKKKYIKSILISIILADFRVKFWKKKHGKLPFFSFVCFIWRVLYIMKDDRNFSCHFCTFYSCSKKKSLKFSICIHSILTDYIMPCIFKKSMVTYYFFSYFVSVETIRSENMFENFLLSLWDRDRSRLIRYFNEFSKIAYKRNLL